jgi:hypothetical protein
MCQHCECATSHQTIGQMFDSHNCNIVEMFNLHSCNLVEIVIIFLADVMLLLDEIHPLVGCS